MTAPHLDLEFVRTRFPALSGEWTYFDNAGGSQTLDRVPQLMTEFLLGCNVQLGASYDVSRRATEAVAAGTRAIATLMGADPGEVVLGPSSTQLLNNLALALGPSLDPGDEVIVTDADHEANVGCWDRLAAKGVVVKTWHVDPETLRLDLDALDRLLGPRTKLVCVGHVSNILGTIHPVQEITKRVHAAGARIVVDGVAYAPHRAIDVAEWDVDFYVFSVYKVYGPHLAALYGKRSALEGLASVHHAFHTTVPEKLQPGHYSYEAAYGCACLDDYYQSLARHHGADATGRQAVIAAHQPIAAHEETLAERLLAFLRDRPGLRIVGERTADRSVRVPTISFVSQGHRSRDVVEAVDPHRIGIRHGHFFAKRLTDALGLHPADGVVRVSMVHYNSLDEVDRLVDTLDRALG